MDQRKKLNANAPEFVPRASPASSSTAAQPPRGSSASLRPLISCRPTTRTYGKSSALIRAHSLHFSALSILFIFPSSFTTVVNYLLSLSSAHFDHVADCPNLWRILSDTSALISAHCLHPLPCILPQQGIQALISQSSSSSPHPSPPSSIPSISKHSQSSSSSPHPSSSIPYSPSSFAAVVNFLLSLSSDHCDHVARPPKPMANTLRHLRPNQRPFPPFLSTLNPLHLPLIRRRQFPNLPHPSPPSSIIYSPSAPPTVIMSPDHPNLWRILSDTSARPFPPFLSTLNPLHLPLILRRRRQFHTLPRPSLPSSIPYSPSPIAHSKPSTSAS